jgi:hypothetical protein
MFLTLRSGQKAASRRLSLWKKVVALRDGGFAGFSRVRGAAFRPARP